MGAFDQVKPATTVLPPEEKQVQLRALAEEFTEDMRAAYARKWNDHCNDAGVEQGELTQVAISSLLAVAAAAAFDIGMPLERFVGLAAHLYGEADRKAPRFAP